MDENLIRKILEALEEHNRILQIMNMRVRKLECPTEQQKEIEVDKVH